MSAPFAISLVYVMYAYSGWNAAIYIIDEVKDAPKNLPRALFWGTVLVMIIYVLVNWVFLRTTPIEAMKGQLDVAFVVAQQILGPSGGRWVAALIALALVSFVNAMIWTGPSVLKVMGEDCPSLRLLAHRSARNVPSYAMWIQFVLVLILLLTAHYEQVMIATQFALTACSLVTALGVIVLRWKSPTLARPYHVWAYPWTPLLFAAICLFTLYYVIRDKPTESLAGLGFVVVGLVFYVWSRRGLKSSPRSPS
jgi:APA family basic amino acid/polyamine antiporter